MRTAAPGAVAVPSRPALRNLSAAMAYITSVEKQVAPWGVSTREHV
jgi:hypothetical protein